MIRTINKNAGLLLAASAAFMLAGCQTDMSELDNYIAEVKARPATPIAPIPEVKSYTPYTYDGYSGRDPFRSSTADGAEQVAQDGNRSGPRPDFDRPREYLERYELDTLTMVGTFSRENAFWGLVRDPDGVVHRVSVENFMGKNHGQIININESEIELSELIADGAGGWLVREASVALETGS